MTTSATTAVPGHPDPDVVIRAESIFAEMGITPQDAIAIFYKQTVLHGTFPIKELIPNEETVEALESARSNEGTTRYASVEAVMAEFRDARISIDDEI